MFDNIILLIKYIARGMFGKCPNCSRKKIFLSHFKMKKSCDNCGIEIGVQRLEARPTATQCIDCKNLNELREKQGY